MLDTGQTTRNHPDQARRRCSALRRDDQPCQAVAVHFVEDSTAPEGRRAFCISHSPLRSPEQALADRRKGGFNRSNAKRALDAAPDDLKSMLREVFSAVEGVRAGNISPSAAQAVAALAGAAVKISEVASLEAQMAELREALAPQRPTPNTRRPALPTRPERQFAPAHAIAADEREDWEG